MLMVYLLCHGGFMLSFQMPCRLAGWPAGTRATDQQVAAELEVERGELRVVSVGEMPDALVGRQFHGVALAKIQDTRRNKPGVPRFARPAMRRNTSSRRRRCFFAILSGSPLTSS